MTDKERILMYLLRWLAKPDFFSEHKPDSWARVDFKDIRDGDLVICQSSGRVALHQWVVGWVHRKIDDHCCVIRDLVDDSLCNVDNESFYALRGDFLRTDQMLTGDRFRFMLKVHKAFARGDKYSYRYGGVEFDGDEVVIKIREAFGGRNGLSVPFECRMQWGKRTSIKAILSAMCEAGYGTRGFAEKEAVKP